MRDELRIDEAFGVGDDLRDVLAAGGSRRARWRAVAAAATSLVVIVGLVTWAYRLAARDPLDVPVIRAEAGPAKMRPEDPGGERFDHQGREVYRAIVGEAPPEGEVALAPPPQRLATEDAPLPDLRAPEPAPESAAAAEADETEIVELGARGDAAEPDPSAPAEPFAAALVEPTARAPVVSLPAPSRRAASAAPSATAAAVGPATPAATPPATPAAVPAAASGGAQLQLGAYLTTDDARRMWETIRGRNRDLLSGRSLALATLDRGGRTLHLLRVAPFADRSEARALCVALKARGEDCLVPGG